METQPSRSGFGVQQEAPQELVTEGNTVDEDVPEEEEEESDEDVEDSHPLAMQDNEVKDPNYVKHSSDEDEVVTETLAVETKALRRNKVRINSCGKKSKSYFDGL
jgi:hypothetical protein